MTQLHGDWRNHACEVTSPSGGRRPSSRVGFNMLEWRIQATSNKPIEVPYREQAGGARITVYKAGPSLGCSTSEYSGSICMVLAAMWAFAAVVLATCFFRRQEICSCRKQFVRRWTLCLASWSVTCDEKPRHCATIEKHLLKTYDPPAPFSGISCLSIPSTRHSHHSRLKTCMLKKFLYANK